MSRTNGHSKPTWRPPISLIIASAAFSIMMIVGAKDMHDWRSAAVSAGIGVAGLWFTKWLADK